MKKRTSTIIIVLVFIVGLCLLLYPTISDYWNSYHQSRVIASYSDNIAELDDDKYNQIWAEANKYNKELAKEPQHFALTDEERLIYESTLNVSGNGTMGYIEIPSINCSLPIYHGTNEAVLQIAVGHLEWSSLPVGGESTHCVISGHRGLPSAKLFTNLDNLLEGDTFMIRTLDEVLTYEVDRILVVNPEDTDDLLIEQGKDYCTLVTCTPYGVNSHRLLVRGHRIENEDNTTVRITADAIQIEPLIVAPVVALPILLVLFIILLVKGSKRKRT